MTTVNLPGLAVWSACSPREDGMEQSLSRPMKDMEQGK